MISLKFKQSSNSVDKLLSRLKERMNPDSSDFSALKLSIGKIYQDAVLKRFDSEMGPGGRKWEPLTDLTKTYKEHGFHLYADFKDKSGDHKIIKTYKRASSTPNKKLRWTGALRKSIKLTSRGNTINLYSSLPYAKTMQYGMKQGINGDFKLPYRRDGKGVNMGVTVLRNYRTEDGEDMTKFAKYLGKGQTPWGNIPARPFLGFDLGSNEVVRRQLIRYLKDVNANYY